MSNRSAKFASAILAGFLAGGQFMIASDKAAGADSCLSAPKGTTPEGSHWYYRIERPSQRHCWYLREETEKVARAEPEAVAPAKPASSSKAAAPPRSLADARAELPAPQASIEQDAGVNAVSRPPQAGMATIGADAAAGTQPSVIASRWPELSAATSPVKTTPPERVAEAPPPAAPIRLATADASQQPSASVPMLLTIILGALSLAAVMGSVIFRFGGSRRVEGIAISADRRPVWHSRGAIGNNADDPNDRIAHMLTQLARSGKT